MVDSDSFHQHTCSVQPLFGPIPWEHCLCWEQHQLLAYLLYESSLSLLIPDACLNFLFLFILPKLLPPTLLFLGKRKERKKQVVSGKPISSCLWNQRMMKNEKIKKNPLMESSTEATLPTVTDQLSELYFYLRNMSYEVMFPDNMKENGGLKGHIQFLAVTIQRWDMGALFLHQISLYWYFRP